MLHPRPPGALRPPVPLMSPQDFPPSRVWPQAPPMTQYPRQQGTWTKMCPPTARPGGSPTSGLFRPRFRPCSRPDASEALVPLGATGQGTSYLFTLCPAYATQNAMVKGTKWSSVGRPPSETRLCRGFVSQACSVFPLLWSKFTSTDSGLEAFFLRSDQSPTAILCCWSLIINFQTSDFPL